MENSPPLRSKRALGQNFLIDQTVIDALVRAAGITKSDRVLEVGAGAGAVTRELAKKARKITAVEIDPDLIPSLKENLKGAKNVEIINADVLKYINTLEKEPRKKLKIVGAIPYQITSPLIHKLLKLKNRPESITFIVQKEVAEKITAKPPKATYLSNFVSHFGEAKVVRIIKPGAFWPQPEVDSAILQISLSTDHYSLNTKRVEALLHRGFAQPRKMIKHRFPAEVLQKAGIQIHLRPAVLSKEDWRNLYRELARVHERAQSVRGGGTWVKY